MRRDAGFTLVELLVALGIGMILLVLAFSTAQGSRRLYDNDVARVSANETLRAANDLITADVRQAGARLPGDLAAVEITDAPGGDTLTIRRSLSELVVPVCKDIKAGSSTDVVFIEQPGSSGGVGTSGACGATSAAQTDASLAQWDALRRAQPDQALDVYMYNPRTRQGEFWSFDKLDNSGGSQGSQFKMHKASGKWENDYPVTDAPRVYLLEQRTYSLEGGLLVLRVRGMDGAGPAQHVVANMTAFQVQALMADGTTRTALDASAGWRNITRLNFSYGASERSAGRTVTRTLAASVYPRNTQSR